MLSKSPRLAVKSKSITPSSIFIYFIGSSPIGASAGNSCIPSLSSGFKNLLSNPSSAIEQSIPQDSTPRFMLLLIVMPPGSFAPGSATITFSPALTLGAPQTICLTSFPVSTLQMCKWSESGCIVHSLTSPITRFVAGINFPSESYSFPTLVIFSANSCNFSSVSKSIFK